MKYLLLALVLSGCEIQIGATPRACTVEQFSLMSKYTEQCERGYIKSYCFDKAQEAYCSTTKESK
jgi:hypothetical protein